VHGPSEDRGRVGADRRSHDLGGGARCHRAASGFVTHEPTWVHNVMLPPRARASSRTNHVVWHVLLPSSALASSRTNPRGCAPCCIDRAGCGRAPLGAAHGSTWQRRHVVLGHGPSRAHAARPWTHVGAAACCPGSDSRRVCFASVGHAAIDVRLAHDDVDLGLLY
jgi:hypothetical protein